MCSDIEITNAYNDLVPTWPNVITINGALFMNSSYLSNFGAMTLLTTITGGLFINVPRAFVPPPGGRAVITHCAVLLAGC